jgi:hypothetical protein
MPWHVTASDLKRLAAREETVELERRGKWTGLHRQAALAPERFRGPMLFAKEPKPFAQAAEFASVIGI